MTGAEAGSLFDLRGKVAVVTAAGHGIGRAIGIALAGAGATVLLSDLDGTAAESVAADIEANGGAAAGMACDVADDAALESFANAAERRYGRIDILVCNAGVSPYVGPLAGAGDADYARTMQVNLRSAWKLSSLITPGMAERGDGAVVFISSIAGVRGNQGVGIYSITKAGVAALARNIAVELGPRNVRANAISPGLIDTDFTRGLTSRPELAERRKAATPLRRFGTAREIAATALYLVSAAGAYTTGQNIVVDGGTTISDGS